jgi:hypothetical protein
VKRERVRLMPDRMLKLPELVVDPVERGFIFTAFNTG